MWSESLSRPSSLAWQPPVTGPYLGMGSNSGTNSPSPVHGLQHPAYGMNGESG